MATSPSISDLADEEFCYLTTTGRTSGLPREIEIWFGVIGTTLYMLSGNRDKSDWVKNISRNSEVKIRISNHLFSGTGRIVDSSAPADAAARKLLVAKYQPNRDGDLTNWGETALPVAVDIKD